MKFKDTEQGLWSRQDKEGKKQKAYIDYKQL